MAYWGEEWTGRRVAPRMAAALVTPPASEPLTLAEAKVRAALDWTTDAAKDALMNGFISAARAKVEKDTGLALLTQTWDVFLDVWPSDYTPVLLPSQCRPLQSVTFIKTTNAGGTVATLSVGNYFVDVAGGRITLTDTGQWPTDLRLFQPINIQVVSGWTSKTLIPPLLMQAVGVLLAHYATLGRDLASTESLEEVPYGYEECIAPYRLFSAA